MNYGRLFLGGVYILLSLLPAVAQQSSGAGQGTGQKQGTQSGAGAGTATGQRGTTRQGQAPPPGQIAQPNQPPPISQPLTSSTGQIGGAPTSRTGPITGGQSLPGAAKVNDGPTTLSLAEAIQLSIQNNLATLLAQEQRREAQGLAQQALAGLLPNLVGTTYQANITQNLSALGFQPGTFPGFTSTFIGPFNNFDARARLVQTIFNLSAIRNYQAGRAGIQLAESQQAVAREQVATATALTYLESLRADRAVIAAQANVDLAQTLLTLARDQRNAGVSTGVDVTRAETRLAQEQVRLAQAQSAAEQARLNLQRVVGIRLGGPLTLTDPLRFAPETLPPIETATAQAAQQRPELRVAESQVRLSDYERRSARAELLPSLEFVGDYGISGITPTNTALPTRRVAIQLNVPIFNGGLTRGRITTATSRQHQAELELSSLRGQVEEDVRLAFATLRTSAEQVRAADQAVTLAERELTMAQDRFRAGVADNIELVTAQVALSNARETQVTALAQYNAARLNLAAALGCAEAFRL